MAQKQFVFLQALPLGKSKRDQELELAKARSHVAKLVHQRERETRQRLSVNAVSQHGHESMKRTPRQHAKQRGPPQAIACPTMSIADAFPDRLARPYVEPPDDTATQEVRQGTMIYMNLARLAPGLVSSFSSLRQGNSDPFDTSPVSISAKINSFMTYTRELYLPALSQDALNLKAVIRSWDWTESVSFLEDEVTAYAHLAKVAAAMSRLSQRESNFATQFLIFKSKGSRLLRERIKSGMVDAKTIHVMSCFHCADVYARDFAAARSHAKILITLFQRNDIPMNYGLLQRTVNHDAQMATMTLARPSFDVEGWITDLFGAYFKSLVEGLPECICLEAMDRSLDKSIDDPRLRDIVVRLRRGLALFLLGVRDPASYATYEHKLFIRHVVNVSFSRLVDHYVDAKMFLDQSPDACAENGYYHVQAFAVLATILWLRKVSRADAVKMGGSAVVFDANELLMSRLEDALEESKWMMAEEQQRKYIRVRLWAIYVGAYLEQVDVAIERQTYPFATASKRYFNVQFAIQVQTMGFTTWQQVREILQSFLHTDVLKPDISMWFADTMAAKVSQAAL